MTSPHPPRPTAKRTLLHAGVIVLATVLALLLVGPRAWARGQINLFGLELAAEVGCGPGERDVRVPEPDVVRGGSSENHSMVSTPER